MYASVISAALLTGAAALGAALPNADTGTQPNPVVQVVSCQGGSSYPAMDAAERQACQPSYTPYGTLTNR